MNTSDPGTADQVAIERYRYLLRTAPPETIEQAHADAFAQLTPEQRREVLEALARETPPAEQARGDDPASLARMATRAELRQPGTLERAFGSIGGRGAGGGFMGGGIGLGGFFLSTLAASFIGTAVAQSFFADHGSYGEGFGAGYDQGAADGGPDASGVGTEGQGATDTAGGDFGGGPSGGGEWGGADPGLESGTDLGTGDIGGGDLGMDLGDFGGGDFGGF